MKTIVFLLPEKARLKIVEKQEIYTEAPKIYAFGFYDGYKMAIQTINKMKNLKENQRVNYNGVEYSVYKKLNNNKVLLHNMEDDSGFIEVNENQLK